MTTAVVLLGHGSRAPEAQQYFLELAAAVREQAGSTLVEAAFLELWGGRPPPRRRAHRGGSAVSPPRTAPPA